MNLRIVVGIVIGTLGVGLLAAAGTLAQTTNPLVGTQWHLVSYGTPEDPTLVFGEDGRATGSGGCNSYGSDYTAADGTISFSVVVSTRMACVDSNLMDQEQAYFAALESASTFELGDGTLTITYGDSRQMIFAQSNPLAGTQWTLVSYGAPDDPTPVIGGSGVTLALGEDGHASGSGGCNSYGGSYTVEGDTLQFSEVVSTLMACVDSDLMDQEQAYLDALNSASAFTLDGDRLTISDEDGQQLVFQQVDPLAGTQWTLASYGDPEDPTPVIEDSGISLTFGQDKQAFGSGGCNTYRGGYAFDGETLRFSAILSTRMACADLDLTAQEQAYFAALEAATGYTVSGDRLTIEYSDDQQLVFNAQAS
jgi:heat shock protein HslJ